MPDLTDLQNAVVDSALGGFQNSMNAAGFLAWQDVENILIHAPVDNGNLNPNANSEIDSINMQMSGAIWGASESEAYESGLQDLKNSLPELAEMTKQDYESRGFDLAGENGYNYERMVKGLVTTMQNDIDLFLGKAGYKQEILEPAEKALLTHFEVSSTQPAMLADMEHRIKDRFYSFSVTSSTTLMQQFTRRLNEIYGRYAAKLQWVHYQGHEPDEVIRDFCVERVYGFFHENEVKLWPLEYPDLWPGAIPGTDSGSIFINLGGYNCRHNLVYVATNTVPKADIERFKRRRENGEL